MAADQSRAARGDREGAQHGVPHAPPRGTRPGAQQGGGAEPRGGPEEPAGTTRGPDGDAAGPDGDAKRVVEVVRPGYGQGEDQLRPAAVVVATEPQEERSGAQASPSAAAEAEPE